jgi:hypothetical protein
MCQSAEIIIIIGVYSGTDFFQSQSKLKDRSIRINLYDLES